MFSHAPKRNYIDDAITFLVQQYDEETVFTRTKLLKFLYLADKEYSTDNHGTITGVAWSKYHYGPYSETIVDRLEAIDGERVHIEAYNVPETGTQYHHRPCSHTLRDENALNQEMIDCLASVLDEHAARDTTDIVEEIVSSPVVSNTEKYGIIPLNT